MFRAIAAFALASASAQSPATLNPTAAWWERVTVLVADDGHAQSCRYESSLKPAKAEDCEVGGYQAKLAEGPASGSKSEFTRITFERRYTPGAQPDAGKLETGDKLLGKQVMALAIDPAGSVRNCKVVAKDGDMTPGYGCEEATSEKFEATAAHAPAHAGEREGVMTVLVYGHEEHVV